MAKRFGQLISPKKVKDIPVFKSICKGGFANQQNPMESPWDTPVPHSMPSALVSP